MTLLRPGRARFAAAATITFLLLAIAGIAQAATQTFVGVDTLRFAWTPAAGTPSGYMVTRSLNGSALQTYSIVTEPKVEIPVVVGDQLKIAVAAVYTGSGGYQVGPQSPLSDVIVVAPSPRFSAPGAWLLRCSTCPALALRPVSNASVLLTERTGLAPPWRILGRAKLQSGRNHIIWHNVTTGAVSVWDELTLAPVAGGTAVSTAVRGVGGADFNGDGVEEFVVQRTDTGIVSAYRLTSSGLTRVADIPNLAGGLLEAVRDFDRDGKLDLLWHDPVLGRLDLWRLAKDPLLGGALSTLLAQTLRLVSGVPSDASVVSTGDYDGDGSRDVLWRYTDGGLGITYLVSGRPDVYVELPLLSGDANRVVVTSLNVDGVAGDEIALQDTTTKLISILVPANPTARIAVVHPGSEWTAVKTGA